MNSIKEGFTILDFETGNNYYTITGFPNKEHCVKDFDCAYDFEDFIQKKINCEGIVFDSEFCQFFAYAKTEKRAKKFLKEISNYFSKINQLLN